MRAIHRKVLLLLAIGGVIGSGLGASMVQKMDLPEICERADKIFRGTVLTVTDGTIQAGGGTLPTLTYMIRVEEEFQGDYMVKDDQTYAKITTLGRIKTAGGSDPLANMPRLEVGGDYLLMTTLPSSIGLSAPVGFGQGSFTISGKGDDIIATDGLGNAVAYADLAAQIRAETEQ